MCVVASRLGRSSQRGSVQCILREGARIMSLDWSQCPAVESILGKVSGAWVLRGTRTPVKVLFENLEAGLSIDEVIERFPVTREQLDSPNPARPQSVLRLLPFSAVLRHRG